MSNPRKRPASGSIWEELAKIQQSKGDKLKATPPSKKSTAEPLKRIDLGKSKFSRTNDDIHSSIDICPVTKALLDSRPMQRLRGVKQLATAEYVYVNCTHTRLEHSLGVAHLAERLAQRIAQRQQSAIGCTPKDILCVKLAGLLHDVGHGPFSHTYEDFLTQLPEYLNANPELEQFYQGVPALPHHYKHEETSLKLIDEALASRGLRINLDKLDEKLEEIEGSEYPILASSMRVFDSSLKEKEAVLTSRDFVFIKECIHGEPIPEIKRTLHAHQFVGRPEPHQEWLYDIVSNRHSGLDVDKIDYFARDHRAAMKGSGETDKPMILEAVVAWGECPKPDQCVVGAAMNFFKQRHYLHKTIYRHKKTDAVGHMVSDILAYADPYFRLKGSNHLTLPLSRAMLDPTAFLRLRDSILDMIANTHDDNLQKARDLIQRLEEGDLYKCAFEQRMNMDNEVHQNLWQEDKKRSQREAEIKQELVNPEKHWHYGKGMKLEAQDIIVDCCSIHCGSGKANPLSRMRFLQKEQMSKALNAESIEDLPEAQEEDENNYKADTPRIFCENSIRLFCRNPAKVELAGHIFSQWLDDQTIQNQQTTPLQEARARSRLQQGTTMVSPPGPLGALY